MALAAALILCGCGGETPPAPPAAPSPAVVSDQEGELLQAIGYARQVPVTEAHAGKVGVTRYDPAKACDGLNFFNSLDAYSASLTTMDGRELHRWASDEKGETWYRFHQRLPSFVPPFLDGWAHSELLANGDLLVIGDLHMLLRLDWSSRVKWKLEVAAHHDVSVTDDGDIYVLTAGIETAEVEGEPCSFLDNRIVVVSEDGEIERTISLFEAFSVDPWRRQLERMLGAVKRVQAEARATLDAGQSPTTPEADELRRLILAGFRGETGEDEGLMAVLFQVKPEDLFHANSIQVLPADRPGLWRRGDILVVIPVLDIIAVIGHESGRVVWTWGRGELERPHHATLLDDGDILIFDNGFRRKYSRIVKVDPGSGCIVWQYTANPPASFYSDSRGGAQMLGNGNVLIAETNNGRAFEVTTDGDIVWEYYNDRLVERHGETQRGGLYRFTRVDPSWIEPLAHDRRPPGSPR